MNEGSTNGKPPTPTTDYIDRATAIKKIKAALERRSGKTWSVTGGRGTAYGWLSINAPPARRTWQWAQTTTPEPPSPGATYCGASGVTPSHRIGSGEEDAILSPADDPWAREAAESGRELRYDWEAELPDKDFGHMSPADRLELSKLLDLDRPVHCQGHSVPSGGAFYREYIERAEGREPTAYGERNWD